MRKISASLEDVAKTLENIKEQAQIDSDQAKSEIHRILQSYSEASVGESNWQDDQILAPIILPDLKIIALEQQAILDGSKQLDSSAVGKTYESIRQKILNSLRESLDNNDFAKADQVIKSWKSIKTGLFKSLQDRRAGANELYYFKSMVEEVDRTIDYSFDQNGFFKQAMIPDDIKKAVSDAESYSQFASEIRIAMNKNRQGHLDAQQKAQQVNFYMMMRSYQELLGFEKNNEKDLTSPDVRKDIESNLLSMVKSGFRFGVSFTPAGKFIDFCELITGKALCTPNGEVLTTTERAFAGLGIFLGSGAVVKKVANSKIIAESKIVADLIEGFSGIILRNKAFIDAAPEKMITSGRRLLRFFLPKTFPPTSAEIIAIAEKTLLDHLRDFKEFKYLDPVVVNAILKEERNYQQPAWDITRGLYKGITSMEKTYVRFYSSDNFIEGGWMIAEDIVKGLSGVQIAKLLALETIPTKYVRVVLPKGTELLVGRVSPNAFGGLKEVMQVFLEKTNPIYFKDTFVLKDIFRGL